MALSLSPTAKSKLKDFLVCFSLGNLCFLRRWYDLEYLKERSMDYYRIRPADPTLLWATLIAAAMLSIAFWLAWLWVQRWPSERKLQFARCDIPAAADFSAGIGAPLLEYRRQSRGLADQRIGIADRGDPGMPAWC